MKTVSEIVDLLLTKRGIENSEEREAFLSPQYATHLHDPFLISGMDVATERILQAIKTGERIAIFADYDCDGIPGAVILSDFLEKISGNKPEIYIPHRYDEGYGMNNRAVDVLSARNIGLIITVDTGISDVEPIAYAIQKGMDVIVTDHHTPLAKLPPAFAILDPLIGDAYPCKHLAGSGVVYKLIQALAKKIRESEPEKWPEESEKWYLDLVGVATIADMVPLCGENRALAHFGLTVLKKTRRHGLNSLLNRARVNKQEITEDDIGYAIAPRINAASRMDDPLRAFELLSVFDEYRARELANYLDKKNSERREMVSGMMSRVKELVQGQSESDVIVVGDETWAPGVLGLVASRAVEIWKRPVFVWGKGEGVSRGSCRSDGTVHMVELMESLPDGLLSDFGGHEKAGGFSILREKINDFRTAVSEAYKKIKGETGASERNEPDMELSVESVSWELYDAIRKMAPFGVGNPRPMFIFNDVMPEDIRKFGKTGEHLEFTVRRYDGSSVPFVHFSGGGEFVARGMPMNVLGYIEKDTFRRPYRLRVRVVGVVH